MDNSRLVDVKPRILDDVDKIKSWKISDIVDPSQMKPLRLPDSVTSAKVDVSFLCHPCLILEKEVWFFGYWL